MSATPEDEQRIRLEDRSDDPMSDEENRDAAPEADKENETPENDAPKKEGAATYYRCPAAQLPAVPTIAN